MGNMATICMWPWAITVIYFSLLTSVCHFSWALLTLLAGFSEEWVLFVSSYARCSFIHICLQVQLIIKCLNMKVLQVKTKFCFCFGASCCLSSRDWVCNKRWKKKPRARCCPALCASFQHPFALEAKVPVLVQQQVHVTLTSGEMEWETWQCCDVNLLPDSKLVPALGTAESQGKLSVVLWNTHKYTPS